jgi:hypothetical protein
MAILAAKQNFLKVCLRLGFALRALADLLPIIGCLVYVGFE